MSAIGELRPFYEGITAYHYSQKPIFDLVEKRNVPVRFHVFPGGPPRAIYFMGMKKVSVKNANPKQHEEVLVSHPRLKMYLMHGGWPYLEDIKAMMYAHPHLHIDIAVIKWALPKAEFYDFLKGLVDAGFGKRIIFGSNQMMWPETIDIAVATVNDATFLTLQQKEDIFYNNAIMFLGLTQQQIEKHKNP